MTETSTSAAGGAANFTGVLYQVLQTLKTVANYVLAKAQQDVILIAEPRGGDLHEQTLSTRTVSQFKTATAGTWPLSTVVEKVLPDLYLAVDLSKPSRYRFVSNARIGTWAEAYEFFRELRNREVTPGDELKAFDARLKRKFAKGYQASERELFLRIVQNVRAHGNAGKENEAATITKVWHLLSNFELAEPTTEKDANREIERLLRELGVAPADVKEKRAALLGFLAFRSAPGAGQFTPSELLAQANLSGTPLSARERSASTARDLFRDDVERARYRSAARIERGFAIVVDRRITCFCGPSGNGKSWEMIAAAEHVLGEYAHAGVYVQSTGDAARDLDEAAAKLSCEVLGRTKASSLRELARDVRDLLPPDDKPWLTICVDNVQTMSEAEGLLANDRELDGVRVLFTAPAAVGQALRPRANVDVVDVGTFTKSELERYLEQHGWDWSEVPSDIRQVIRQPLLARLFIEVAGRPDWKGTTEYALFAAYSALLTSGLQIDCPQDAVMLRELALDTAKGRVPYPWSAQVLREAGINDEVRRRLERAGWLRREADAGASIWHDRLLNWAVAEALVGKMRSKAVTVDEFAAALSASAPRFGHSRYGYVPMDALWLVSAEGQLSTEDQVRVLRKLEESHELRLESLYGKLVPTLGARILPALILRIEQMDSDHRYETSIFAAALFGTVAHGLSTDQVRCLLTSDNARAQDVALRYLARSPRPDLLDDIWKLHVNRQETDDPELRHLDYDIPYAALAAGCRRAPDWLRQRIGGSTPESARVWDLAFLVAGLSNEEGEAMWRDTKDHLFALLPKPRARALVRCIHVYKDTDEIARLDGLLGEEKDAVGSAAFAALVTLDPQRAIASVERMSASELGLTRSWWMPWLMLKLPDTTQEHLRQRLLAAPTDLWDAAGYFSGFEELINPDTLERLLQMLVALIPGYMTQAPGAPLGRPDVLLRVIARCTHTPQIRVLERHRGKATEMQLTALAIHWLADDHRHHELKYLRVVLQRIGGDGYLSFVRESLRGLGPDDYSSDLYLTEACVPEVIPELQDVADRFIDADPRSQAHTIAFYALRLVASTGDRDRLITAALKRDGNIEADVPQLLAGHAPTNDESFVHLLTQLQNGVGEERARAAYALGMTGRGDAIPELRKLSGDANDPEVRRAAHYAIDALIRQDVSVEPAAINNSVDQKARFRALFHVGTADALNRVEAELLSAERPELDVLDFAAALLDTSRGPRVAAWMWKALEHLHPLMWDAEWWEALRYVPEARDFLLEHAIDGDSEVRPLAASTLAEVDLAAGSTAIAYTFRDRIPQHFQLACVLLRCDPQSATVTLRDHMLSESDESCRMAIGRAYRRYPDTIQVMLPEMFCSPDAETRRCACEIAGWLRGTPCRTELVTLAFEDRSMRVRQAAIDALRRQAEFTAAEELRAELIAATGMRAFTYADALAETVDPIVLSTTDDPLCIWAAVAGKPRLLTLHVKKKLETCAKAVATRAEKKTRERHREVD